MPQLDFAVVVEETMNRNKSKTILGFCIAVVTVLAVQLSMFAQTPPYPASQVITKVDFNWTTKKQLAPGSDNWPMTWAADGHQYTSWGDGGGFGGTNNDGRVSLGVGRVEGTKGSYKGYNVWGGKNAENPAEFDGKSYGIVSVGGVLYMWVSPGSCEQNYTKVRMAKSTNKGANWTRSSWSFTQSQDLMIPTILQFGKDYAGARDGYVYSYFIHPSPASGTGGCLLIQKPGKIYLARVAKSQIMTQSAYEFFTGFDSSKNPKWSTTISSKVPVFQDKDNGVGWTVSVSYNAGLKRYLLITEHTLTYPYGGNIGIYDAPEPWGPWTTAYFATPWAGSSSKCFYWNFSNKWASSDGKSFVLVYTAEDKWNTVEGTFTVGTTTTSPPSAPTGLKVTGVTASLSPAAPTGLTVTGVIASLLPASRVLDRLLQATGWFGGRRVPSEIAWLRDPDPAGIIPRNSGTAPAFQQ
jgi:hypothetical protein